jgi:Flp pilus assembly pilin Flp
MIATIVRVMREERGASMPEYAVVAVGLAVPAIIFLALIAQSCGVVLGNSGDGMLKIATKLQ